MGKTESYYGFALRVEGLAKKVYGGKYKKPLKEKYVESVTKNFSEHLKQLNWNTRTMCGRSLTWNEIKERAALQRRETSSKDALEDLVQIDNAEKVEGKKFKEVWPKSAKGENKNTDINSPNKGAVNKEQCRVCQGSGKSINTQVKQEQQQPEMKGQGTTGTCWFCGKSGHWARECRYKNGLCAGCGARDHFVKDCPKRQRSRYPPPAPGRNEMNGSGPWYPPQRPGGNEAGGSGPWYPPQRPGVNEASGSGLWYPPQPTGMNVPGGFQPNPHQYTPDDTRNGSTRGRGRGNGPREQQGRRTSEQEEILN